MLRPWLDRQARRFAPGAPLERLRPLWDAFDTFLYTPSIVTPGAPHVRDGADLKRIMMTVVLALLPAAAMALYNTGLQTNLALAAGAEPLPGWRELLLLRLGAGHSPDSLFDCLLGGAIWYLPILAVTFAVGGAWEFLFVVLRRQEVNEAFLVTGMLFPLILPPTIPLWQVALGISFGIVLGKEVFGGVGMNVFNPALTGRAFLFFAYPVRITGSECWVAVDGVSGATPMAAAAEGGLAALQQVGWWQAFLGLIPGSLGETSTLAVLLGAGLLLTWHLWILADLPGATL